MYYSVGATTADFKVAGNITVSGSTATFSAVQTGNIGVGDKIDYDTDNKICYITGKTSQTVWTVKSATGGVPTAASNVTLNSITRAFNTLADALHGATPGAADASHLNTLDLVTATIQLNIACYDDSADDDSLCSVTTDWTVDSSYYIKIYTPIDTVNECNNSQRHDGTYDGSGYVIKSTSAATTCNITIAANYTKVFGIKVIRTSTNWSFCGAITAAAANAGNSCEIAYNAVFQDSGGDNGHLLYWRSSATDGINAYIHDNFVGSNSGTLKKGLHINLDYQNSEARQSEFYNNTVYGSFVDGATVIDINNSAASAYLPLIKNNYAYNSDATGPDYSFTGADYSNADSEFAYNASDDTTAGTSNNNQRLQLSGVNFNDTTYATLDLHIGQSSSLCGQGIGPSSDSNVSTNDIDQDLRSGSTTDIGADVLSTNPGVSNMTSSTLILDLTI